MSAVVADTHTLIWYLSEPTRLSVDALTALRRAVAVGDAIYVSAISLVEVIYLSEKGRITAEARTDFEAALREPASGIVAVSVDVAVTQAMEAISRSTVPEMPDRIIAATARYLAVPLVTRDLRIRALSIPTIW